MKTMLTLLAGVIFVCTSCNDDSYNYSYGATSAASQNTAESTAENTEENNSKEECVNEEAVSTNAQEGLRNTGGYNYSDTETEVDFEGSVGAGTGQSYASSYYGSKTRKEENSVCTMEGNREMTPDVEHDNAENFYTEPENQDDLWNSESTSEYESPEQETSDQKAYNEDEYNTIDW